MLRTETLMPIQNSKRRRRLLQAMGAAGVTSTGLLLSGCAIGSKKNIRDFGKTYDYLCDPERRRQETGDALLVVRDAEISGTLFHAIEWRNIRFVDCDFQGAYETKLASSSDCVFEGCRFTGIHSFGNMRNVRFLKCHVLGETFVSGRRHSQAVLFEECTFKGSTDEVNHWGDVGTYGEATFIRCKAKWFGISGDTKLTIRDCEFESVESRSDSSEIGGVYSTVLIEKSKFRGLFNMVNADLQNLEIRDTALDAIDLTRARVKGDIVMERVRGGSMQIAVQEGAHNLVLKDSQISGDGIAVCGIYVGAFQSVLIEKTVFGGGRDQVVVIGGGYEPGEKSPQPVLTQSLVFRNSTIPALRSGRLNAARVLFERNEIGSLQIDQSRIGALEVTGNSFARTVDFTDTQAQESKVQPLAKGQAKLDGSNVKVG